MTDPQVPAAKTLGSLSALTSKAIEDEVSNLFDVSLVSIMLRAWKKYEVVRKQLRGNGASSSEAVLLPLVEHSIESEHKPYVQISRGETPLFKITFSASLQLSVEGLVLKIRDRRIREIAAGRFYASGTLKCEEVTICEKHSEHLNFPGSFAVGSKDEADAAE
jgi:hypothetical protein